LHALGLFKFLAKQSVRSCVGHERHITLTAITDTAKSGPTVFSTRQGIQ
jgi:hypothetical protein